MEAEGADKAEEDRVLNILSKLPELLGSKKWFSFTEQNKEPFGDLQGSEAWGEGFSSLLRVSVVLYSGLFRNQC